MMESLIMSLCQRTPVCSPSWDGEQRALCRQGFSIMGVTYGVYGDLKLPAKSADAWRRAPLEDRRAWPSTIVEMGMSFEPCTVADVLAQAAAFGAGDGQVFDLTLRGNDLEVRVLL